MTKHVADVAIVGAGAIGLLSALQLVRRGRNVTVYADEPARNPASWAGGGILSPLFPWRYSDSLTRLTRNAVGDYQRLAAELNVDFEVMPQGLLAITDEVDEVLAWCRRHHVVVERHASGWFFPYLGSIRNPRLLSLLRQALEREGVSFVPERVTHILDAEEGVEVKAAHAETLYQQVVIAAGAWSAEFLEPWGAKLPIEPVKGQMLLWDLGKDSPDKILLSDNGYFIPRRNGLCLFGSTMEYTFDNSLPTRFGYDALLKQARDLMPALKEKTPVAIWAGLRPGNTRDEPYIFPVDSRKRLWVNSGHYRNGLVAAPASARLLAQWMCGEALEFDPAPYGEA